MLRISVQEDLQEELALLVRRQLRDVDRILAVCSDSDYPDEPGEDQDDKYLISPLDSRAAIEELDELRQHLKRVLFLIAKFQAPGGQPVERLGLLTGTLGEPRPRLQQVG